MADPKSTPVKRKRFDVTLSRLVREEQVVTVEAESESLVLARAEDVYAAAEGSSFDSLWLPDMDWGYEEGAHKVREVPSDEKRYVDDCQFTVTHNGVSRWARPTTVFEDAVASVLTDRALTKRLSNLSDSKFTARFVVQDGRVKVKIEDFEDLDG